MAQLTGQLLPLLKKLSPERGAIMQVYLHHFGAAAIPDIDSTVGKVQRIMGDASDVKHTTREATLDAAHKRTAAWRRAKWGLQFARR